MDADRCKCGAQLGMSDPQWTKRHAGQATGRCYACWAVARSNAAMEKVDGPSVGEEFMAARRVHWVRQLVSRGVPWTQAERAVAERGREALR